MLNKLFRRVSERMVQTGFSTWHAAGPRRLSRAGRAPTRMPGVLGSRRSRSGRSAGRSARQTGLAAGKQWARMRMLIVTPASAPRRCALCVCKNQVPSAGNAACARRRRSHGSPRTGTACTPRPRRGKAWRWPARARLRLQDGYAAGGRAAHAHQHVVRKAPGAGHSARVQEAPALPALVPTRHSCSHKPDASQRPCGLPP